MLFPSIAAIGGFAALAAANQIEKRNYFTQVECIDKTVTVTVTAGAGGAGATPPPATITGATGGAPAGGASGAPATTVYTSGDKITSVEYSTKTTSTYCPSAGKYNNPYKSGETITVDKATWVTVPVPYSTVYVYAPGAGKKNCDRYVYQDKTTIEVTVIVIDITINNGVTATSTVTTATDKPSGSPVPPPPSPPSNNNGTNTNTTGTVIDVELRAANGKVFYNPDRVNAKIGDVINFKFFQQEHSATQSTFDTPCTHLEGGFDSGLIPNPNNTIVPPPNRMFTVNSDKPLWFYCKQPKANHCGQGMVFGINPGDKMDQFIANAKKQNGALVTAATSATASSTASSTTSSTTTTGSASTTSSGATATYSVKVGGKNGDSPILAFDPPFLSNVKRGDKIHFDFLAANHTLTESSLESPCSKKSGTNIDTNFMNANKNNVPGQNATDIVIDTDGARFFYCKQTGHCSKGMVFGINIDQSKFNDLQAAAKKTAPPAIKGRRVEPWSA